MKIPVSTTLWNFVPMMFVMLNECIQGLRLIHEVYTLFQDRRRETEPQGSLEMEQNSSNHFQRLLLCKLNPYISGVMLSYILLISLLL